MRDAAVRLLAQNPLLLLFLVAAIGYPLGRIRFRGSQIGGQLRDLGVGLIHLFLRHSAGGKDQNADERKNNDQFRLHGFCDYDHHLGL